MNVANAARESIEFYTCRYCGTAYARAYTDDVDSPSALWSEPGRRLRMEGGETSPLLPLDMLLEESSPGRPVEPADYDLETGRFNPNGTGTADAHRLSCATIARHRRPMMMMAMVMSIKAWRHAASSFHAHVAARPSSGRTTVQDHQTKGDQPFQALVARQIQIQPANAAKAQPLCPASRPQGAGLLGFPAGRRATCTESANVFDAGFAAAAYRVGLQQTPAVQCPEPPCRAG